MDFSRYLVSDLLARPGSHRDEDVAVPVRLSSDSVTVDGVATGRLRIEAAGAVIVVRGSVAVPATITCSRCLVEFEGELVTDLTATYGDPDDPDARPISGDGRIDLAEAVHEELAMVMPAAPVCREDCRGLCAVCGSDLNVDPCDGHEEPSSSPFAALEDLFPTE
ncbi:MAG: DUF177 domain-containing protein [Acidimicrobiia bacterium]